MDDNEADLSKESREKLRKELRGYARKKHKTAYIIIISIIALLFTVPPLVVMSGIFHAGDLSQLILSLRMILYCTMHQCTEPLEGPPV